jgi:exopolysaccharide biosynthesis polyprenyl glycosylphosphotransferase
MPPSGRVPWMLAVRLERQMIRRYMTALHLGLITLEAVGAAGLFILVSLVRYGPTWESSWRRIGIDPWIAAILYAATWVAALWLNDLYRLRARLTFRRDFIDIVRAALLVAVGVFSILFVAKFPDVSRLFLLALFGAQVVFTLTTRSALRLFFSLARQRGYNRRFVLIVGGGPAAQAFADLLESHRELGLRVIGHLADESGAAHLPDRPSRMNEATGLSRPILGRASDIAEVLHGRVVDEVAICLEVGASALVDPITQICEQEGKIVRIPVATGLVVPHGRTEEFDGIQVVSLLHGPERTLALLAKRLADIVVAIAALIVLSPVLLVTGLWLRIIDGPPVLFSQIRVGLNGRQFRIYKLRTMVPDAEARYAEVAALSDTRGAAFKMKDDPRVTRLGRFLRRTSIDELPQLWNVIRGEMSIVGPRPAPPREVADYDVWHRRRLSMKPGITGLWQVESRLDEEFDERAALDLAYIDRWSLWLDLKIIVRTVPAMLQGH